MASNSSIQTQWQAAAQTVSKPKMDMSKALAIMGFSSSRTLDTVGGHDPKAELANALCRQMANLERKKKMSISKQHAKAIEAKQRDDVRILHEAYQFLSRKYNSPSKSEEEENVGISPMDLLGAQSSGGYKFDDNVDVPTSSADSITENLTQNNDSD